MRPHSRRRVLQLGAAAGTFALAGCLEGNRSARAPAQRRIEHATQPPDGTWPSAGYDARNTRTNPSASPPRSDPAAVWSAPLSGVVSALVVGPEYVYASTDAETVALARDGDEGWRVGVGGDALAYHAGRVYVSGDTLRALDATSGAERWRSFTGDASPGAVYETSGTVYVTGRTHVYGVHPDSGARRWDIETARYPSIVADDARVGVLTSDRIQFVAPGETVDGLLRDPGPRTSESVRLGWSPEVYSGVLTDDALFVPQYGDRLADTNATVRRYDLPLEDDRWMTPYTWAGIGTIAVDEDRVYASPYRATTDPPDGSLVALDRRRGTERWRYDGSMLGPPAVGGDTVVAGGADPGSPSVCVSTANTTPDCPPAEGPAETGVLHGFDAATGEQLWTIRPGASYGGYPVALVGDRVYYGDGEGVHVLE